MTWTLQVFPIYKTCKSRFKELCKAFNWPVLISLEWKEHLSPNACMLGAFPVHKCTDLKGTSNYQKLLLFPHRSTFSHA